VTKKKPKYSGGRHSVKYGRREIEYDLTYSDRQSLTIDVHPDMKVVVKAPVGKAPGEVARRVKRRGQWIIKQLTYFERFQPLPIPREYVGGETHVYLGRQYRLKIIESFREDVKLVGRYFEVYTEQKGNSSRVAKLVKEWYDRHVQAALDRRLDACMEIAGKAGLLRPEVLYRNMKRRWGSCTKSDRITLNIELVKAPVHCIDYVIMHELCHLRYKNHSPEFWRLLSKLMPDWEKRKNRLEQVII